MLSLTPELARLPESVVRPKAYFGLLLDGFEELPLVRGKGRVLCGGRHSVAN